MSGDLYAGIVFGFMPPHIQAAIIAQRAQDNAEAAARCIPQAREWSDKLKWEPELAIRADSWRPAVQPWLDGWGLPTIAPAAVEPGLKCGEWLLVNRTLPKGRWLGTRQGNRKGRVCFDADVAVPTLVIKRSWGDLDVMMSLTPMELWSLRGGTRLAKGHVVIAGLGLGYQLVKVMQRKQVARVTVVERSQTVVDMVWPVVSKMVDAGRVEVVVGDAKQVVPGIACDVVLADVDASYGGNTFPHCPKAGRVWVWGAA